MIKSPKCPNCQSDMFVWEGKGFHKGKSFWLCKEYRKSCGDEFKKSSILITEEIDKETIRQSERTKEKQKIDVLNQIAVNWPDSARRNAWKSFYYTIGSAPSYLQQSLSKAKENITRVISQTNYLIKNDHLREIQNPNDDTKFLLSILKKILQRGEVPNVTLFTEEELIKKFNLDNSLEAVSDDTDLARCLDPSIVIDDISLIDEFLKKNDLIMDKEFDHANKPNSLWDHQSEKDFVSNWIKPKLGTLALNSFIPQASLDTILKSYKDTRGFAKRRIDFLFCHPLVELHI